MTTSDSMASTVLINEPHICTSVELDLQLCSCFNKCKCVYNCESQSADVEKLLAMRPGTRKICICSSFTVVQQASRFRRLLIEMSAVFPTNDFLRAQARYASSQETLSGEDKDYGYIKLLAL